MNTHPDEPIVGEAGHLSSRPPLPPPLGLLLGVLAASTASPLIRLAQQEAVSLAVAAWRMLLAALLLAPYALTARRAELRSMTRREWVLALISGLFLALHFATWISSLALTSVAVSVVLVATSPLWVGLISHLFLGERLSRSQALGLAVALAGSAVIGFGDAGQGTHRLVGDGLALAGALSAAGYFLIGRRLRTRLSLVGYVFPVYGTAAVALLLTAGLRGVPMGGYAPITWLWLLLLAIGPQILGHSSLNWALRHVSATFVTLATLGEPIGSTLLAWLILREAPGWSAVLGGGLILIGIMVAGRSEPTASLSNRPNRL